MSTTTTVLGVSGISARLADQPLRLTVVVGASNCLTHPEQSR
jgi:hypothetical protein